MTTIANFLDAIRIIQGGMGVYISTPLLAKLVALLGGLGNVSGVATERILVRTLGRGDSGGHYRRALSHFPFPEIVERILKTYYVPEENFIGIDKNAPVYSLQPSRNLKELIVCATFCLVWLAKEGHDKPIGINFLTKIEMPQLYALYGAMLARVNVVTMGAGIPLHIPDAIDAFMEGRPASYPISFDGQRETFVMYFDPREIFGENLLTLTRPAFIPIIASNLLGEILVKKLAGRFDGFGVETEFAGGHNAPPRGKPFKLDDKGNLVYGPRDQVDLRKLKSLGYPFWIGGSYASPEKLAWALSEGATGIQVGTAFALCEQSGFLPDLRRKIRWLAYFGWLDVRTSPTASPTGFPLKVAQLEGTVSSDSTYANRGRVCDQGALKVPYRMPDGKVVTRCPAEPIKDWLRKGGTLAEAEGRRCVCNGLLSTAGLGNIDVDGGITEVGHRKLREPPLVTIGDDANRLMSHLMSGPDASYDVGDVFKYLLGPTA